MYTKLHKDQNTTSQLYVIPQNRVRTNKCQNIYFYVENYSTTCSLLRIVIQINNCKDLIYNFARNTITKISTQIIHKLKQ